VCVCVFGRGSDADIFGDGWPEMKKSLVFFTLS
jgi:hypothetical protein